MINISHTCYYTRRKTTIIGSAESSFYGVGVPLEVILPAFSGKEIVWFSLSYGEKQNNTLLVGLTPSIAARQQKVRHGETSPIQNASVTDGFEEYVLSDEVRKDLGITFEGNTYRVSRMEDIRYLVYVHDGCFSSVEPVDQELLKQLVQCVLMQHSFYQDVTVDWSAVIAPITEEAGKTERLKLRSYKKRYLTIRRFGGAWEFTRAIMELLLPGFFRAITIDDGKAHFTKNYLRKSDAT